MLRNIFGAVLSKMQFSLSEENSSMAGPDESEFKKADRRRTSDGVPLIARRRNDPAYRSIYA